MRATYQNFCVSPLAPHLEGWAQAQPDAAVSAWNATLPALASHPRCRLLDDLNILLPFWMSLVSEVQLQAVAEEVYWAIQVVGRWWP